MSNIGEDFPSSIQSHEIGWQHRSQQVGLLLLGVILITVRPIKLDLILKEDGPLLYSFQAHG